MGIQKDAGELLMYCYGKYQKGEYNDGEKFREISGWDKIRARNAVRYLSDMRLVEGPISDEGEFIVTKLLPQGIDIIENESKFNMP